MYQATVRAGKKHANRAKWLPSAVLLVGLCAHGLVSADQHNNLDPSSDVPEPALGTQAQVIETFSPPERVKVEMPSYPRSNLTSGQEGWVTISHMVDPEGRPYDVVVVASSGDAKFEKAAVRAVAKSKFSPAHLGGRAIDAGSAMHIVFEIGGAKGASRGFVRQYKKLRPAIDSGDRAEADALLAKLASRSKTLYEDAFYYLGVYDYQLRWGTVAEQYAALVRASHLDGSRGFLPKKALIQVLRQKINAELKLSLLAQARKTTQAYAKLTDDEESDQFVDRVLGRIEEISAQPGRLSTTGLVADSYRYTHRLLKSKFHFDDIDGDIAELRLHCDKGYVGFIFEAGIQYSVNRDFSECVLTVIGDPATTFTLIEQ